MNIFGRTNAGRDITSRPDFVRGRSSFATLFKMRAANATKALPAPGVRTSPRPALGNSSLYANAFSSGDWPLDYTTQVREAYLKNAVAQRAVRLISEGVATIPITVLANDPMDADAALGLLRATSLGQVLLETATAHLLLHGNAYIQLITDNAGNLSELYALRPDRITIEADSRGWPLAYVYRVDGNVTRIPVRDRYNRPNLVHLKAMHPLDDHYGLGCLGAAAGAIASHNAATKWNKILLDNAARPSGALVYNPGEAGAVLSSEQYDRLRTEIDAHFSGPANAGRPMLLEGGLSWQALSLSPTDMDFINLKAASARDIALAFGVPPALLGLPGDAAYSNYREANRALWRMAIIPMATKLITAVAEGMQGWLPGVAFSVDMDNISALADDREKIWAQVAVAAFLTNDEKRALLGLPAAATPPISIPDILESEI